jgi:hypothetical protein
MEKMVDEGVRLRKVVVEEETPTFCRRNKRCFGSMRVSLVLFCILFYVILIGWFLLALTSATVFKTPVHDGQ